jgi:cell fate regulator YaaT (PSP1 superfamily)
MTPEMVEISFKGNKRVPYLNPKEIEVKQGDYAIVEADKGIDLGIVSKVGRLAVITDMKCAPKNLIRKAESDDLERLDENRCKEKVALSVCCEKVKKHGLNMKLVDVEYQYDLNKLTFYFTSDKRVDFRELVKDLAAKYRTRIELRQIGVRDEARRLGGLGICGKPFCCSMFIKNFEPITTQSAKDQNLTLNPGKLTGVCGRLKCCLLYEKSFYSSSLERYPMVESDVDTNRGKAIIDKIDIFREVVYLRYEDEDEIEMITLKELKILMKKAAIA